MSRASTLGTSRLSKVVLSLRRFLGHIGLASLEHIAQPTNRHDAHGVIQLLAQTVHDYFDRIGPRLAGLLKDLGEQHAALHGPPAVLKEHVERRMLATGQCKRLACQREKLAVAVI